MPKLTAIPAAKPVQLWTVDHKPSAQLMAEIRSTLRALDAAGADQVTDFWVQELHLINGHPNLKRWTDGALYLMQRDLMQAELAAL
jgi:hypothetical protein